MIQLLREWTPGYGGVERTAHQLAVACGGSVACLRAGPHGQSDPLPVPYRRFHLPSLALGRLLLVLPTPALLRLLWSRQPLLAHQPCPTVLAIAWLARLIQPSRSLRFYWHAFVQPRRGVVGLLEGLYLRLALRMMASARVITTSPVLREALLQAGVPDRAVDVLPCCLPVSVESPLRLQRSQRGSTPHGRLIFIGRLDSYKRVDWLLQAFAATPAARELVVIGDGPDRGRLEAQAASLKCPAQSVHFLGRVSEACKRERLLEADLLVLPSNRCNEAFGIVQLEAMASGIPSLAFDLPCSGMHWVSQLPDLPWTGAPDDLPAVLQAVLSDSALHGRLCRQACERYDRLFATEVWSPSLARVLEGWCG